MKKISLLLLCVLAGAPAARAAVTPAKSERLENGVVYIQRPDRLSPRVAYSLLLRTGAAEETPETAGWRRLAVNAILRGVPKGYETPGEDSESLTRAAEAAGGQIGATVGDDFVEVYAVGDSAHGEDLLKLALAVIRDPRLSDDDINSARERQQVQLDSDTSDTATRTQSALHNQLYRDARGELVAYGLPDYGTSDSLKNLTNDKIRDLYNTRLRNARLTVSAVGDVNSAADTAYLETLPATHAMTPAEPYFAPIKGKEPSLVVREIPSPVAWVFVAYSLPHAAPADLPALRIATAALGDSGKARLPARLLSKGLVTNRDAAYTVAAQLTPRRYSGEILLYAQTGAQSVDSVKNALLDEMNKLKTGTLTPAELQSAKNYLRGAWPVERDNLRDRAFQTALSPALGGPMDTAWPASVQSVTAADVQRVAKKYFNSYSVALVMPSN